MKTGKALKKTITTSPMRRISPPVSGKTVSMPVSKVDNKDALIDALYERVHDLEARLQRLESAVSVDDQGVVINASGSVLIQGMGTVEISAGTLKCAASLVEMNTALTKLTGLVECASLTANTVTATTYTPGAGNIW